MQRQRRSASRSLRSVYGSAGCPSLRQSSAGCPSLRRVRREPQDFCKEPPANRIFLHQILSRVVSAG